MEQTGNSFGLVSSEVDTHMSKNNEWGAVAYLTHSIYGRCINSTTCTEIGINNNTSYVTGYGSPAGSDENVTNGAYNTTLGQNASTTGNIYGIYDMSGGANENVMGFYQEENGNIHTGNSTSSNSGFNGYLNDGTEKTDGIAFPTEKKYYQLYKNTEDSGYYVDGGMLGDAIKETKGWNSDRAMFVCCESPVSQRGGYYPEAVRTGSFCFINDYSGKGSGSSFRVCLCVI